MSARRRTSDPTNPSEITLPAKRRAPTRFPTTGVLPIRIQRARAHLADAVLLIVAALDRVQLIDFYHLARQEFDLDALLEVHHERELDLVLERLPEARLIGINNRDLSTFVTTLDVTLRLAKRVPVGKLIVSESGIFTRDDVKQVAAKDYRFSAMVSEIVNSRPFQMRSGDGANQ